MPGKPRKKKGNNHGGRREGAGRPSKNGKPGEPHGLRPDVTERNPVLVTLLLGPEVRQLSARGAHAAWRSALTRMLRRGDFRVIHIAFRPAQVDLICEADDRMALSNGVRALQISVAHRLNAALGEELGIERRLGRVFEDRYRAKVLATQEQCRSELTELLTRPVPPDHEPLPVSYPTAWLLTKGWWRWGEPRD